MSNATRQRERPTATDPARGVPERGCEGGYGGMPLAHAPGDRKAAQRQYERCMDALEKTLDVGPAGRTVELDEQIRADHCGSAAAGEVHTERAGRAGGR